MPKHRIYREHVLVRLTTEEKRILDANAREVKASLSRFVGWLIVDDNRRYEEFQLAVDREREALEREAREADTP